MNTQALDFFRQNYAPGRVCLVGLTDPIYELIRIGQAKITPDRKRSKWNHTFLMGERRGSPGREKLFILESDFHFSWREFQFINGPQESLLEKWCKDSIEHACVLGMDLKPEEQRKVLSTGIDKLFPNAKLSKLEFTFELSDHMPLWIQIDTDTDAERIDQILVAKKPQ
jgi:hypothetical protein